MDSNDIIAVHFVFVSIGFSQAEVMRGVSVCAVDRQCGVLSVLPPTLYTRSRRVEVLSPTLLFLPSYSQPQPQLSNTHPPTLTSLITPRFSLTSQYPSPSPTHSYIEVKECYIWSVSKTID